MTDPQCCYQDVRDWKYILTKDHHHTVTGVLIPSATEGDLEVRHQDKLFIKLTTQGELTIYEGYAWDGPSGPTVDTLSFMRGSLVHDG